MMRLCLLPSELLDLITGFAVNSGTDAMLLASTNNLLFSSDAQHGKYKVDAVVLSRDRTLFEWSRKYYTVPLTPAVLFTLAQCGHVDIVKGLWNDDAYGRFFIISGAASGGQLNLLKSIAFDRWRYAETIYRLAVSNGHRDLVAWIERVSDTPPALCLRE